MIWVKFLQIICIRNYYTDTHALSSVSTCRHTGEPVMKIIPFRSKQVSGAVASVGLADLWPDWPVTSTGIDPG